jgi:hypothetical protein
MPTLEPNTNAKKSASIISLAEYREHRFPSRDDDAPPPPSPLAARPAVVSQVSAIAPLAGFRLEAA